MDVQSLLLLLSILHPIFCCIQRSNMSNLRTTYTKHCGYDLLCSTVDTIGTSAESLYTSISPKQCPMCFCTEDCEVHQNCCPDRLLMRTCVQTKFQFKTQSFAGENLYLMVSSCPQTNSNLREDSCMVPINHTNFLNQVPVYSPRSNRTYTNIQCSKCYGEIQVIPWRYYIECPRENVDLDFYTNVTHLWHDMQQNDCTIDYIPPLNSTVLPCDKKPNLVGECNVTGHWEEYDEDIISACKQYENQYGVFQNIFCFFCNTAKDQIGLSLSKHELLRLMTSNECSNSNEKFLYRYIDTVVAITEKYDPENSKYSAFLNVLSWNAVDELQTVLSQNIVTIDSNEENIVNLTSLYEEFVKSGGYENWCQENHTVERIFPGYKGRRDCSCDDDCYKFSACCPDAAFYQRMDCVPGVLGQISNSKNTEYFYLISKCPIDYKFSYLKSKCEESSELNLFNIPVTDVRNDKAYKNLYCYLCHHQQEINTLNFTKDHVKTWNVKLTCTDILFPMHVTTYTSLLKLAFDNKCFIQFTTTNFVDLCKSEKSDIFEKCNATGRIKSLSKSAKLLCENTGMMVMKKSSNYLFKNKICDFCNNNVYEEPLSVCLIHKRVHCDSSLLDVQAYPFKNNLCRTCNKLEYEYTRGTFSILDQFPKETIMDIFEQSSAQTDTFSTKECSKVQFKDIYKGICRKIFCTKGKYLADGSCSYLVPYGKNFHYRLALQVLVPTNQSIRSFTLGVVQRLIQREINEGDVQLEEMYIYSNEKCTQVDSNSPNGTSIQVLLSIRITNNRFPIKRKSLEAHLLNLLDITTNFENVTFVFQRSTYAWYLPLFVRHSEVTNDGCYVTRSLNRSSSDDTNIIPYTYDVNDMLECIQIQLEANEFILSDEHSNMYVKSLKKTFKINEFVRNKNGSVRICLSSYVPLTDELSESKPTLIDKILTVTTYICTIASLLFLLATFVIYCILRVLRTVPGKNIMCFAFSLFFAQLFSIIRSSVTENSITCSWVGGLTHYFWISAFTWTNVCCFHMFKLFVKQSFAHGDVSADRKLFITYFVTSFSFSLVPIGANLVVGESGTDSLRFGYGGSKCFFKSPIALLITFIFPIVLQILFNITMFSITFHFIRNTPKAQSSKERNDLSIFFKLFLLTGVSWVFIIVDGFFEVSPFTFLATIISGSLGILIFISYVYHKKVLKLLRHSLCPDDDPV